MFNTITWIALSVSNFFNFYDNKDYYLDKEKPNYQAMVGREHKKAHKSELLKENNKEKIVDYK
tara:strand:+ start:12299 stop:12487 length:189 start_codon:yes stop_codon:yes gene_type:complete